MYDLASAVMYVGGPANAGALIDAYLEQEVLDRAEVERTLRPMLRLRWAVQADYFARRLSMNDLTGIENADDNEIGLEDARKGLAGPGN
jgi:homoserine kinase type II